MTLTPREILKVARPISWFNTVFAVAGGAFVAGGSFALGAQSAGAGVLHAAVQPDPLRHQTTSAIIPPTASIRARTRSRGGLLPPETHRPMLALIAALNAPAPAPRCWRPAIGARNGVLAFLLATTVAYSAPPLRLKEVAGLDSFISATHYVTPFVYGLALNRAAKLPHARDRRVRRLVHGLAIVRGDFRDTEFDRGGRLRLGRDRDRAARHGARRHRALPPHRRADP